MKKPDHIVWDEETQKYNAALLPYGSSISAPAIVLDDVGAFKERGVNRVQKTFGAKYQELVDEYNHLVDEVKLNEVIYNSKYSFEPVIGNIYHLYENKNGIYFLSLISPNEWRQKHIISVRLNSEHKWVSIKDT